ncbi:MAG: PAS domain S-box protein, partial [Chloroflexota bacterium]
MKVEPRAPRADSAPANANEPGGLLFAHNPLPMWVYDLETCQFLAVNHAAVKQYGYSEAEFREMTLRDIRPLEDVERLLDDLKRERPALQDSGMWRHRRKDGSVIAVEIHSHTIEYEGRQAALVVAMDVTASARAERALRESEAKLQGVIDTAMDAIVTIDEEQRILLFNPAAERMYRCSAAEALGQPLTRFMPESVRAVHAEYVRSFGNSNASKRSMQSPAMELMCMRADGETFPSEVSISHLDVGGRKIYTAIVRDISERKRGEEQRRIVAETQAWLLQADDIPETYRYVAEQVSRLIGGGITLTTMLDEASQTLRVVAYAGLDVPVAQVIKTLRLDPAQTVYRLEDMTEDEIKSFRRGKLERLEGGLHALSTRRIPKPICAAAEKLLRVKGVYTLGFVWQGRHFGGLSILARADLEPYTETIELIANQAVIAINRLRAEHALRRSEDRYRDLVENIHDLIGTHDLQGNILTVNAAAAKLLGVENGTLLKMNLRDLLVPEARGQFDDYLAAIQRDGQARGVMHAQTSSGERRYWEYDNTLRADTGGAPIVRAMARDVTERRQAEESLRESEERYRAIFDGVHEAIFVESLDGRIQAVNDRACEMYGYSREEFIAKTVADLVPESRSILWLGEGTGALSSAPLETVNRRANGEEFPIEISGRMQTIRGETVLLVVARDITERKRAEEKIASQVRRLSALREIDAAIASSFDLNLALDVLLNHATAQLGVDAAAILLFNRALVELEFAAEKGFRGRAIRQARLRPGENHAGKALLESRMIYIPDLDKTAQPFPVPDWTKDEGFVSFAVVPLVVKGQAIGVLEVFHRSLLQPEEDWFEYLQTLAGQAAIAVEESELFVNLQRRNFELVSAYDATIEGWSRALDLRDKETEGHTQRVTA